ncbi:MAG: sodium/proline symporter [Myxococcota bacterium]|jgi:sodium/proline symporter|nr:sodium/proline symporter [Myxococcota bacterium]
MADGTLTWKLIGIVSYLTILLVIGIVASRRMKDLREYFAAGKSLNFWAVAFSARATGESAWLLLGLTGMGAVLGVRAFWVVLGEVIGVGGAWLLMSRRFKRLTDRYDSITVPDYLESRFRDQSHYLRIVSAAALVVFVTIYVSAQIDATGKAFEMFLNWNYYAGALVGFAVVLVYITSGGFLAVAWSDVFQGALMFFGLVTLPLVAAQTTGGFGTVFNGLEKIDPSLLSLAGPSGWTSISIAGAIGLSLIGLGFLGSPQIFVRFIAMRSEKEIPKGTAVAIVWTLLADSGAVLVGMIGRFLLDPNPTLTKLGSGGENVLPMLVEHTMPAVLIGLYIAIVLSAIMSTVDSLLVVASSACVRDWYQKVKHPELPDDKLVGISRKATVALALVALLVAMGVAITTPNRTIFWFVIFGWSGIAATFCPTIILSLFWSKMTGKGALAAMVTGFLAVPIFKFGVANLPEIGPIFKALEELPPSFALSAIVGILVSLWDKAGQEKMQGIAEELEG